MGEFNAAVSTLLEAFGSGIAIIRSLRHRRKESKSQIDPTVKAEESRLSKTLKKNRVDVRNVYESKVERLGQRFSDGDVKAHSALTSILFRLNAGFVSIIERFTQGKSTRTDYQTLVNLSNASRVEAIRTFEQLSSRLSQSSMALGTVKPKRRTHSGSKSQKPVGSQASATSHSGRTRHARPRSAPELSIKQTALGPATTQGWVRTKTPQQQQQRRRKRKPIDSGSSRRKSGTPDRPKSSSTVSPILPSASASASTSRYPPARAQHATTSTNRMSIMSFASGSTKIGEIPDRHAAMTRADDEEEQPLAYTAFPLSPWKRPEKPRSRFMRLFKK